MEAMWRWSHAEIVQFGSGTALRAVMISVLAATIGVAGEALGTCDRAGSCSIEQNVTAEGEAERLDRLRAIYGPERESDGGFPIDEDSKILLDVLAQAAPAEASKLKLQLRQHPLQLQARKGLCDALVAHGDSRPQEQRFSEFALCYRRFMETFDFVETLSEENPLRKPLLNVQASAARLCGDRLITFSDTRGDRLAEAVTWLRKGLSGNGACSPDSPECLTASANLLLALHLQNVPQSELEAGLAFVSDIPGLTVHWADPLSIHVQLPGIRTQAIWDPAEIPWLPEVSSKSGTIREELDSYIQERASAAKGMVWEHQPNSGYLAGAAQWNSVDLFMNGEWKEANCRMYFPKTCAMLRGRPELDVRNFHWPKEVLAQAGLAQKLRPPMLMVNIYQAVPGARIRPHFGTHSRLVASMGLKAPPGAVLHVGGEKRTWEEGQWLLFDDAFMHEVVNNSTEPRYVLAVAMLHPDTCAGC